MAASAVVAHSFESTPFSHGTLAAYLRKWHKREAFYEYLCATGPCGLPEPGAALSANAADITTLMAPAAPVEETESGWQFTIAPHFWMAGLSGDTAQLGLPTVHIGSSFSDI